jgi:hypothetical protein
MKILTLSGHVEDNTIRLDEPFSLPPDARLLITVLPANASESESDWARLSLQGLTAAYGDDEPDYSAALNKVRNRK